MSTAAICKQHFIIRKFSYLLMRNIGKVSSERYLEFKNSSKNEQKNKDWTISKTGKHFSKDVNHKNEKDIPLQTFSHNADVFGNIQNDSQMSITMYNDAEGEDDKQEIEFLNNKVGRTKLTINQYGRIIKRFIQQKKVS